MPRAPGSTSPIPDVYLTQFPITNAAAIGADHPIVLVNSRTIELLDEHELRTVLGHEAGHILSEHVLYRTALMTCSRSGCAGCRYGRAAAAGRQVRAARVVPCLRADLRPRGALVNRDPLVTSRTLMVMAAGVKSKKLNLDTFLKQANEYEEWEPGWDRLSRLRTEFGQTHAAPVRVCRRS